MNTNFINNFGVDASKYFEDFILISKGAGNNKIVLLNPPLRIPDQEEKPVYPDEMAPRILGIGRN